MLKRRLSANFGANLFAQGVSAFVQLASIPVFLACWSKEHYGEWLLLFSIPGYLALADAGLSNSAANEASMFMAQGKADQARRSLHTATGLLGIASSGMMAVLLGVAWLIPWTRWLRLEETASGDAAIVAVMLGVYTVAGLAISLYGAAYRAAQRVPRSVYLTGGLRLGELAVTALVVVHSPSLILLAAALTAVRVATLLAMHADLRRFALEVRPGLRAFSWDEVKRTWRPSLLFMAFPLGNALYFQGITLLAGRLLGPGAVVVINTTRALTRGIVQLVTIIKHSTLPEFSHLYGAGDLPKARRLHEAAFEVTWIASLFLSLLLLAAGPTLMSLWTHATVSVDRALLALFLAGAVMNSLWAVSSGLLLGINQHAGLAFCYLGAVVVSLAAALGLVPSMGLSGIALAMLLCEAMILPYALVRSNALLRQPIRRFLLGTLCLRESYAACRAFLQTHSQKSSV